MPFVIVGLFVALVLAATAATRSVLRHPTSAPIKRTEEQNEEDFATRIGIFFWILLIALIVAIIARYV